MLSGLPFYEELNVIETNHAFRGYAMSCKTELVEKKIELHNTNHKFSLENAFSRNFVQDW